MDFEFHQNHLVLDKPEYLFDIDEYRRGQEQFLLAHISVHEWSPRVLKMILHDWRLFRQCVTAPLFACAGPGDTDKWERFVSRLGFRFLRNVICENGEPRRLFIHAVQPRCQPDLINDGLQQTKN